MPEKHPDQGEALRSDRSYGAGSTAVRQAPVSPSSDMSNHQGMLIGRMLLSWDRGTRPKPTPPQPTAGTTGTVVSTDLPSFPTVHRRARRRIVRGPDGKPGHHHPLEWLHVAGVLGTVRRRIVRNRTDSRVATIGNGLRAVAKITGAGTATSLAVAAVG